MKTIRPLYLIAALCLAQHAFAQLTPQQALRNIENHYATATSYSMQLEVGIYTYKASKTPERTHPGKVWKSGEQFRSEYGAMQTIYNNKHFLMVDHAHRTIVYNQGLKREDSLSNDIAAITQEFEGESNMSWGLQEDDDRSVVITPQGGTYEKVEFFINTKSLQLQKVIYHYRKSAATPYEKVVIEYADVNVGKPIPNSIFSEKQFIKFKNGTPVAQAAYTRYRVVDQTKINKEVKP